MDIDIQYTYIDNHTENDIEYRVTFDQACMYNVIRYMVSPHLTNKTVLFVISLFFLKDIVLVIEFLIVYVIDPPPFNKINYFCLFLL